ncbi:hypothetical protein N0V95_000534, partial [Ascochyta clinopodiicola]
MQNLDSRKVEDTIRYILGAMFLYDVAIAQSLRMRDGRGLPTGKIHGLVRRAWTAFVDEEPDVKTLEEVTKFVIDGHRFRLMGEAVGQG